MKSAQAKIPPAVLAQALGLAIIMGTPVIFVGFNQVRRVCGSRLFGSREHFCSAHDLGTWLLSLSGWTYGILAIAAIVMLALIRLFLRRMAS